MLSFLNSKGIFFAFSSWLATFGFVNCVFCIDLRWILNQDLKIRFSSNIILSWLSHVNKRSRTSGYHSDAFLHYPVPAFLFFQHYRDLCCCISMRKSWSSFTSLWFRNLRSEILFSWNLFNITTEDLSQTSRSRFICKKVKICQINGIFNFNFGIF